MINALEAKILLNFIAKNKERFNEVIKYMPSKKLVKIFNFLPPYELGDVANSLDLDILARIFSGLSSTAKIKIFENISHEKILELSSSLTEDDFLAVSRVLKKEHLKKIKNINSYKVDEVGYYANPKLLFLPEDYLVKKSLKYIKQSDDHTEKDIVYILDKSKELVGYVKLSIIACAPVNDSLGKYIKKDILYLHATEKISDALQKKEWLKMDKMLILNSKGKIIGDIDYRILLLCNKNMNISYKKSSPNTNTFFDIYINLLDELISNTSKFISRRM